MGVEDLATTRVASTKDIPTPTEAAAEPLQNAYYVYDGDGNLVKSIINGKSTYYLGKLYQKKIDGTEETIQKYYSSGSAQIAVRTVQGEEATLQWILSDHLGSTSTTANADGTWNSTIQYTAFGEIRASSGITPTEFRYTGQLRQAELGLYYYVARWYDPAIAHFTQADTIVPNAGDSAAYDRYAYGLNNPVKYFDPSGHKYCDGENSYECSPYSTSIEDTAQKYGIRFKGKWGLPEQLAALAGVEKVGAKLSGTGGNAGAAFKKKFGSINFTFGGEGAMGDCATAISGGCASTSHQINFWSLSGHVFTDMDRMTKNVVHELGHAFDKSFGYYNSENRWMQASSTMPDNVYYKNVREFVLRPNIANGELSPNYLDWQQHPPSMDALGSSRGETFADMFIAWTYDAWSTDPVNSIAVSFVQEYFNNLVK